MASSMKSSKDPPKFECHICRRRLASKQRLGTHQVSYHGQDRSEELYKCGLCGKRVSTKRNLDRHRRLLHKRSPLKGVYKQYRHDPEVCIPDRTLRRLNGKASKDFVKGPLLVAETNTTAHNSDIEQVSTNSDSHNLLIDVDNEYSSDSSTCTSKLREKYIDSEQDSVISSCNFNTDVDNVYSSDSSSFKGNEPQMESEDDSDLDSHKTMNDINCEYSSDSSSLKVNDYSVELESETDFVLTDTASEYSEDANDFSVSEDSTEDSSSENMATDTKWTDSDSSELQAIELCIQAYVKRYNLSNEATKHLRELISVLCPESIMKQPATQKDIKCIHYCIKCNEIFPTDKDVFECSKCNNLRYEGNFTDQTKAHRRPRGSFVVANIHDQLENLLEKAGIWTSVQHIKQGIIEGNSDGNIHDIFDGEAYKNLCQDGQFLNNRDNLSAIINTDGIPLYSSSKVKLWPVFVAINEIPPEHRFSRENLILAGMWQGKGNPPFKQYISSLAIELNKLYTDGIFICPFDNGNKINVKLCVLCATLDLQAKGYVANMTMHNGQYGCSTCEESGIVVKKGRGHVRSYPYRSASDKPPKRNSSAVEADGRHSSRDHRLKGICGVSGLSALLGFNLVDGLVPDYMHGLLLGITKTLMTLWFSTSSVGRDFFIGNRLKEISIRVSGMTPPDSIERLPRDLEQHYTHFKATEYQVWLLFYCIPCTKGILPDKYLEHFGLLAESSFLLLGDSITEENLLTAKNLLDSFYEKCGELYGPGVCGLNVHNAGAHLADFVKIWGPVWCWSCFPFEDMNAAILKSVHGTGDVTRQAVYAKQYDMQLNKLSVEASRIENEKIRHLVMKVSGRKKKWRATKQVGPCRTAGRMRQLTVAECSEELLQSTSSICANDLKKCFRVELDGQKYFSQQYHRMKKRICHFVICHSGEIAAIQYFVVNKQYEVFAVVKLYEVPVDCNFFVSSARHIFKIKFTEQIKIINVLQIMDKLFYMAIDEENYVARMPNILGRSVFK